MAKRTFDLSTLVAAAVTLTLSSPWTAAWAASNKGGSAVQGNDAFTLANSLAGHNLYKEAVVKYRQAISANPHNPKIYHMYGRTLALMGLFNDAMDQYKIVLKLRPAPDSDLEYDFGVAAAASGDNADGARHLKKAVTISPQHIAAYNNLGVTLSRLGDFKAAKEAFEISLRLQPTNKSIETRLSELTARLGDSKPFDYNAPPEPTRKPPVIDTAETETQKPLAAETPPPKPAAAKEPVKPVPPPKNAENPTQARPHVHAAAVEQPADSRPIETVSRPVVHHRKPPAETAQTATDPSKVKPPVAVSGAEAPPLTTSDPSLTGVSTSLRNLESDDEDATTAATSTSTTTGGTATPTTSGGVAGGTAAATTSGGATGGTAGGAGTAGAPPAQGGATATTSAATGSTVMPASGASSGSATAAATTTPASTTTGAAVPAGTTPSASSIGSATSAESASSPNPGNTTNSGVTVGGDTEIRFGSIGGGASGSSAASSTHDDDSILPRGAPTDSVVPASLDSSNSAANVTKPGDASCTTPTGSPPALNPAGETKPAGDPATIK